MATCLNGVDVTISPDVDVTLGPGVDVCIGPVVGVEDIPTPLCDEAIAPAPVNTGADKKKGRKTK